MTLQENPGLAYLIHQANSVSAESIRSVLHSAIAEAGGPIAVEYLISRAKATNADSKKLELYRLIGRASRVEAF